MVRFFEKILKNKKLKFLLPFFSTILLILPGGFVQAASLGSRVGGFFISLIGLILYLFSLVANMLMRLGGGLLSRVITLTFNENLFIEAPFVKVTWGFTRDLANIFFIAWLVIIAIATIIDYKGYQAKKLLPRLIIVAILVNFSLVICGVVLDMAQGVMGFLTQSAITIEGQPYGLAEGLVLAFNQSELFGATMPGLGSFFGGINAAVNTVMQNALVLVFAAIAAYVFILLSVMMLVRVGALWLLLIFAPLTWVVGIMPFGTKIFKDWMSNFFKWAFYGVVVAFFLYLSAMAVWAIQESSWQESNFGATANMGGGRFGTNISFLENFSSLLSFMVVMILLLMAKSTGMKASKNGGDMITGAIGGYIGGKVATMGKWSKRKTIDKGMDKGREYKDRAKAVMGNDLMDNKISQRLSRIPIVGGAVGGAIGRATARTGAKMKGEASKAQTDRRSKAQDYSNLTEEQRKKLVTSLRGTELESMTETMIKNGEVQKLSNQQGTEEYVTLKRMNKASKRAGNETLRENFEAKRVDMITDPSNYELSKTEILRSQGAADPQYEREQIVIRKQAEAEARKEKAMKKAKKDGEFRNEDFVKNLSAEDIQKITLDKDSAKALMGAVGDFSEEVKNHVLTQLQAGFSDGFDENVDADKNNMKLRSTYAKVSGDYHQAYELDPYRLNEMNPGQREIAIQESQVRQEPTRLAISKIKGEKQWGVLKDDANNTRLIARNMQASQVSDAGRFLDASTKEKIFREIELLYENPNITEVELEKLTKIYMAMLKNDTWPGEK